MSLDAAFSGMIDTIYRMDGHAATYDPRDGITQSVSVLRTLALALSGFETSPARAEHVFHIRRSEVAQPARGDVLTIGEECWTVADVEPVDGNRWEWRLVVRS